MWNFNTMEMGFSVGKKDVRLAGIVHLELKAVGSRVVHKTLEKNKGKGMLLQIRLVNEGEGQKVEGEEWEPWVQKYLAVFGKINGLPPRRNHDHRILLLPGMGLTNVKPYRYPTTKNRRLKRW